MANEPTTPAEAVARATKEIVEAIHAWRDAIVQAHSVNPQVHYFHSDLLLYFVLNRVNMKGYVGKIDKPGKTARKTVSTSTVSFAATALHWVRYPKVRAR